MPRLGLETGGIEDIQSKQDLARFIKSTMQQDAGVLDPSAVNGLPGRLAAIPSNVLASAHIFVGNAGNVATDVAMTGDVTINNAGVTAIGADKITAAMIGADQVGSSEIVADAVGSSEIAADAVGQSEIAANAVGTGEIIDANVTDAKLASPNNGAYRNLIASGAFGVGLAVTATKVVFTTSGGVSTGASGTVIPDEIYFANADHTVAGKTQKLRVRAQCNTNGTAPGITITFGLYPITASGGATASQITFTIGTVVSGSTVAFVTPGANTQNQNNSGDFTIPADGYYALGYVGSAGIAANAGAALTAQLQTRHV